MAVTVVQQLTQIANQLRETVEQVPIQMAYLVVQVAFQIVTTLKQMETEETLLGLLTILKLLVELPEEVALEAALVPDLAITVLALDLELEPEVTEQCGTTMLQQTLVMVTEQVAVVAVQIQMQAMLFHRVLLADPA
jgi:hypothetical protein